MSNDFSSPAITYLVYNELARKALQTVLENRTIAFRDIIGRLKKSEASLDTEQARSALKELEQMELVEATPSGVADFDTYYATASGLEVGRMIGI